MVKMARKLVVVMMAVLLLAYAGSASAAGSTNVALKAKATASTEFNKDNAAQNAVDGKKVQHGAGEWASKGEITPWLKLEWKKAVTVDKIVIFDRPNTLDNANGGTITFSDGSKLEVTDIDPAGKATEIKLKKAKTITSLKFTINGAGSNVGLAEVQVFGKEAAKKSTKGGKKK